MPLEVDNQLQNTMAGNIQVTPSNTFVMPSNVDITTCDLLDAVEYYQNNMLPKFQMDKNYYDGKHKIFNMPHKEIYKPDNRILINFPKKAINDFNGFFISNPVNINVPDNDNQINNADGINDLINRWGNTVNLEKVNLQVSKLASMYGIAYYYVYQDENGDTQLTYASPLNTFLIYDDTPATNPLYAVQFTNNYQNQLEITLTSEQYSWTYVDDPSNNQYLTQVGNASINPYGCIPVIELAENDEKMAMCKDLYTVFDAIDKAMSEKANDVDYFADAYLKLVNVRIPGKDQKEKQKNLVKIKSDRTINANSVNGQPAPDIGFLGKPDADATQEHLIDRLVNSVYEIIGITNINDQAFAGNPSGVSLQIKFSAMKNMATTKSIYMQSSLRQVFQCLFNVSEGIDNDAWQLLNFKFTQNVPRNLTEIGSFINSAYGKLSQKLLLSVTGLTNDIEGELAEESNEKQANMQLTSNMVQNQPNNDNSSNGNVGD